jgi:secreted Zn-dependent insulinase-like peptidase
VNTITSILNKIGVEGLYHGNVDVTDAERAQREILDLLQKEGGGLSRKKYPQPFVFQLPQNSSKTLLCPAKDPTDPNTAVEVYFQVGKDNTFDRVMVDLLMEMMYEPLYDQLRTKDQFGYSVSCDSRWTEGVIGMQMQVVTSSKTAQQCDDRMEQFLTEYRQILVDMSQTDFTEHLAALAKRKLDMFHSLSEETNHLWSEIRDGRLDAFDRWLFPGDNNKRRRMVVQVICSEGPASEGRPEVPTNSVMVYNDTCVKEFHKYCKGQTFGRIY